MLRENRKIYMNGESYNRPLKKGEYRKKVLGQIAMDQYLLLLLKKMNASQNQIQKRQELLARHQAMLKNVDQYIRPPKHKRKKVSIDKLEPLVLNIVLQKTIVSADDIALQLNVKTHLVKQVFARLNQKGILSQAENRIPHDITRGEDAAIRGWQSSFYYVRSKNNEFED